MRRDLRVVIAGVAAAVTAGIADSRAADGVADAAEGQDGARFVPKPVATVHGGVTGLPHSRIGQRFATLDDYLAHLRAGGAIDRPWYEEVKPGLYELRTAVRPAPSSGRVYRRVELERMFGFAATPPR